MFARRLLFQSMRPRLASEVVAVLLVAVLLMCWEVRADCVLVVLGDRSHTLVENEEWCSVIIGFGGQVHTNGHTLTITGSGGLTILDGISTLFVDGGTLVLSGGGTHYIAGGIPLSESSPLLRIINADSTLSGPGWIRGCTISAKIDIGANAKLRTTGGGGSGAFDIAGGLTIQGSGEFRNDGKVVADEPGWPLMIAGSVALSGGGVFEASGSHLAVLSMNVDSACAAMSARFVLRDEATIEFLNDADVRTSNTFNPAIQCGKLNFDPSGGSFTYNCGGSAVMISSDTTYEGGCL